uniref:Uncharacterized protein n=1 Tax=Anguilla anguilla TaxID=7936 RepID=A0A0E9U980_ANGAN
MSFNDFQVATSRSRLEITYPSST